MNGVETSTKTSPDKNSSYDVTEEDVKRYLAFLNPTDEEVKEEIRLGGDEQVKSPQETIQGERVKQEGERGKRERDIRSDSHMEEEQEEEEEEEVGGEEDDSEEEEEEPDSPSLLTAMTFYDHSPGEVYTIHEDEDEASSPTASDGVSRPRRKGGWVAAPPSPFFLLHQSR